MPIATLNACHETILPARTVAEATEPPRLDLPGPPEEDLRNLRIRHGNLSLNTRVQIFLCSDP